jgi:hypothetical protein
MEVTGFAIGIALRRAAPAFRKSTHDRGYAASHEQAMAAFKTAWERKP